MPTSTRQNVPVLRVIFGEFESSPGGDVGIDPYRNTKEPPGDVSLRLREALFILLSGQNTEVLQQNHKADAN